MSFNLQKSKDIFKKEKFGISLEVFSDIGDCGFVLIDTEESHNQEFYDKESSFNYIILEGKGVFTLDDEDVSVSKSDFISIEPNTRIYYKGRMKLMLITNPAWKPDNEVETKERVW